MKNILRMAALAALTLSMTGCQSCSDAMKAKRADISGLDRVATVYAWDGTPIRTYRGSIRVSSGEFGKNLSVDDQIVNLSDNMSVIVEEASLYDKIHEAE